MKTKLSSLEPRRYVIPGNVIMFQRSDIRVDILPVTHVCRMSPPSVLQILDVLNSHTGGGFSPFVCAPVSPEFYYCVAKSDPSAMST